MIGVTALLAVIGLVTYGSRDYLARGGANYLLRGTDVHVVSVEVRTVGTQGLAFDRVLIDLGNEDSLEALNFRLPLFRAAADGLPVTIERLIVVSGSADPPAIADGLLSFLSIPAEIDVLDIAIDELVLASYPEIRQVRFRVSDGQQTLALKLDEYVATVISTTAEVGEFQIEGSVSGVQDDDTVAFVAAVTSVQGSAHIEGKATYRFPALLPLIRDLGVVPDSLETLEGIVEADHRFAIPIDGRKPFEILAEAAPRAGFQLAYGIDGSPPIVARLSALDTVDFALAYPAMNWRAAINEVKFTAEWDDLTDTIVELTSLHCESGIKCAFDIMATLPQFAADAISAENFHINGPVEVAIGESKTTARSTELMITADRLTAGSARAIDAAVAFRAPVLLSVTDDHWRFEADAATTSFGEVYIDDSIALVAEPRLSQMYYRSNPEVGRVTVSLDGILTQLSFDDYSIRVPDIAAHVHLADGAVTSKVNVVTFDDSLSAVAQLVIPPDSEQNELQLESLLADFGNASASSWLQESNFPGDLVGGTVNLSGQLSVNSVGEVNGLINIDGNELSGFFKDYVFKGFDVDGPVSVGIFQDYARDEISVRGDVIDIGIPITDFFSSFSADPYRQTIQFSALGASLLGGKVDIEPFSYNATEKTTNFTVSLEAVPLEALINYLDMPTLSASGSVSGQIPVAVSGGQVSVESGFIASDRSGGVVSYLPGDASLENVVPNSQLGTVTRALSNFVYEDLSSSVSYSDEGDLEARMTLRGTNPDLDPLQPIVLNLSLQNNIPDFLRSMRASRSIEELLEQQLNR